MNGKAKAKKRRSPVRHPMQPVVWDGKGVTRFLANPIVRFLLDWASSRGMSLNELTVVGNEAGWTKHDWSHFSQLHGYSLSGWGSLSYATDAEWDEAAKLEAALLKRHPKDPKKRRREFHVYVRAA